MSKQTKRNSVAVTVIETQGVRVEAENHSFGNGGFSKAMKYGILNYFGAPGLSSEFQHTEYFENSSKVQKVIKLFLKRRILTYYAITP